MGIFYEARDNHTWNCPPSIIYIGVPTYIKGKTGADFIIILSAAGDC